MTFLLPCIVLPSVIHHFALLDSGDDVTQSTGTWEEGRSGRLRRWLAEANGGGKTKAPQTRLSRGTFVEQPSHEVCSQPPYVLTRSGNGSDGGKCSFGSVISS